MRKAELVASVLSLLPPDTAWPQDPDARLAGGRTVFMAVAALPSPKLALKLVDFVYHNHNTNFWAKSADNRHVIMDACHNGVHPSVLLRLVKYARKTSLKVVVPMSRRDADGRDAIEIAVRAGHGQLASCLLGDDDPVWIHDLLCRHSPLEVLEFAIESKNEQCVLQLLANKRVARDLQPGAAAHLNANTRWEQRVVRVKRFFNVYTCVGMAVRCDTPRIVEAIYEVNFKETPQAVWYALYKLKHSGRKVEVSPEIRRMASEYLVDLLPQLRDILIVRNWEFLMKQERSSSLWRLVWHMRRFSRRDWSYIAKNPWAKLPVEMLLLILTFLLPSEALQAEKVAAFVEYKQK